MACVDRDGTRTRQQRPPAVRGGLGQLRGRLCALRCKVLRVMSSRIKFMTNYLKDFEITEQGLMKSFLGVEVEQNGQTIKLHLNHY